MASEPEVEVLSAHLSAYVDGLLSEGGTKEEHLLTNRLLKVATSSLEGFVPETAEEIIRFLQASAGHWRWAADEHYSLECVRAIPSIVRRFLSLAPVLTGQVPDGDVTIYLREATRCFLYGFFQGSTALCRAALEAGANEALRRRLGTIPTCDLVNKLNTLERLRALRPADAGAAHSVRKAGGRVLHQSPAPEQLAFDSLVKVRKVLTCRAIFGPVET